MSHGTKQFERSVGGYLADGLTVLLAIGVVGSLIQLEWLGNYGYNALADWLVFYIPATLCLMIGILLRLNVRRIRVEPADDDGSAGLHVVGLFGSRRLPWITIRRAWMGFGGLRIQTADGRIRWLPGIAGADDLCRLIRGRVGDATLVARRPPAAAERRGGQVFVPTAGGWLLEATRVLWPVALIAVAFLFRQGLVYLADGGSGPPPLFYHGVWAVVMSSPAAGRWFGFVMVPVARACRPEWWLIGTSLLLVASACRTIVRLRIDETGVQIVPLVGAIRDLPWATIRKVVSDWHGLRLLAGSGTVSLGSGVRLWTDVVGLVEQRLVQARRQGTSAAGWTWEARADGRWPTWLLGGLLWPVSPVLAIGTVAIGGLLKLARTCVVTVDAEAEGLVLRPLLGAPRRYSWARMIGIDTCRSGFRIRLRGGTARAITFTLRDEGPRPLLEAGLDRARQSAEAIERIDRDEVARWLVIEPEGYVSVRALRWRPLVLGAIGWGAAIAALIGFCECWSGWSDVQRSGWMTVALWPLFWVLYYPVHLALLLRADALREVFASTDGLRWREGRVWRQAGWDQVEAVDRVPRVGRPVLLYWNQDSMAADCEILVACGAQRLRFHPRDRHAMRLHTALQHLLAARRQGLVLPTMTEVPAAAISRAAPAASSPERGLSRV